MKKTSFLTIVLGWTTFNPVYAANDLYGGIGSQQVTLLEHDIRTGQRLVKEQGWIPGVSYGLYWPIDQWRVDLQVQQSYGVIPYDGQTQAGVPHQTDTTHFISQARLAIGLKVDHRLEPYLGLSLQEMVRNVANRNNIYGATETYDQALLRLGVRHTLLERPQHLLQFWLEWQKSVYAHSAVDSRVSTDLELTLSHDTAGAFGLHYQQGWTPRLSWFIDGDWQYRRYQDSTMVNYTYQPPITFRQVSLYSGLSWHFD